ncbi:hypothetical protein ACIBG8_23780 [Nonomuraea sp. NPDC050556]|uniref:hypothetical protein n=1 Tax=Nonomuraea sp. NPDC050556 TaxID=3364369 RepID=UPI0037986D4C
MRAIHPVGLLAVLILAGCSGGDPAGQQVEVVAKVDGSLRDIEVGPDGTPRLLVDGAVWEVKGGTARKVDLGLTSAEQLAVAKDGTMYVSSGTGLWQVPPGGKAQQIVGNGQKGFTPDGQDATGPAGPISGVALDQQGRVVYTESLTTGTGLNALVRRVEGGKIVTVAGTSADGEQAADPPAGTKATSLALTGGYYTTLASGEDGTLFVNGKQSVLAIAPDGTVQASVAGRDPKAVKDAASPFEPEGKATDAAPMLFGPDVPPNLSSEAGSLALSSWEQGTAPPAAYRWTGEFTKGQQAIVDAVFGTENHSTTTWPRIRLVRKDGTITTAAWSARSAALRNGWLYLGISDPEKGVLVARVKVP